MQYQYTKPKPLAQLSKKYKISNSRLYQIWRGQDTGNKIHDTKISKSTNPASEEDVISDSKVKKTGGRKSRTKTVCASDSISSTESSEDVLDLYKRTNNDIEKIRASGRALTSK
ncbi:hypothetical protein GLOIN_2v1848972 [Rhizophagus clarus]|uniref:Uncharacterized protein n=1 Tax=Rhizophagus clarus TaxID=94130 RepID=A0A8H3QED0_9GLOM|nr:hypothetical protein GLOIN_2v1848972 [Rhizophagus clarus]